MVYLFSPNIKLVRFVYVERLALTIAAPGLYVLIIFIYELLVPVCFGPVLFFNPPLSALILDPTILGNKTTAKQHPSSSLAVL